MQKKVGLHIAHMKKTNLMSEMWRNRYENKRIVRWDNTNVRMPKLGNADMQRITYSQYCSVNCAKGGAMLELCD